MYCYEEDITDTNLDSRGDTGSIDHYTGVAHSLFFFRTILRGLRTRRFCRTTRLLFYMASLARMVLVMLGPLPLHQPPRQLLHLSTAGGAPHRLRTRAPRPPGHHPHPPQFRLLPPRSPPVFPPKTGAPSWWSCRTDNFRERSRSS